MSQKSHAFQERPEIPRTSSTAARRSARAWVPSHITGLFRAHRREDPMRSGSIGAGLCLFMGATTTATITTINSPDNATEPAKSNLSDSISILLNGQASEAPVSRLVAERLARLHSGGPVGDSLSIQLQTDLKMPFGAGFGASGAGALGVACALNSALDLGLTANQAASVAHEAEVTSRTGLGDVIAQNTGGLVLRLSPGAPGIGVVDRVPVSPLQISFVVRGPISTSSVLSDDGLMRSVNSAGEAALKDLLKRPTFADFMRLSRRFTLQSGLASEWALDAIEAVEAVGGLASMIMLGDAVFAWGEVGEEGGLDRRVAEALKEFGEVHTTTISQRGANLD